MRKNSQEKNKLILKKIVSYCDEIEQSNAFFGNDEQKFKSDDGFIYRNACGMCIVQIGELAGRLSDDVKDAYPEVPWKEIKGMRNFFAHEYDRMDTEDVWYTIQNDIPVLKQNCTRILKDMNPKIGKTR